MPEVSLDASALSTALMEVIAATPAIARAADGGRVALFGATAVSTSEFQAAHDGHWPCHLGEAAPHCWHR
jgi:hypothetical protein